MPFNIIRDDIVRLEVDAIVNAANPDLKNGGGGVCGRIFEAAGVEEMTAACDAIGGCSTGSAVITPGFNLPAKYVIHTVGPVWQGGERGEETLLRSAYRASLRLATEHDLESVAFPLLSSGNFRYPYEQALAVALDEINRYIFQNDMQVTLVMFDQTATALGFKLRSDLISYIDDHYVEEHLNLNRPREHYGPWAGPIAKQEKPPREKPGALHDEDLLYSVQMQPGIVFDNALVFPREKTFSEAVLSIIDAKGMTDVEAYRGSNLDRRLFSKIRSKTRYNPSKSTVLALTIGLKLSVEEAEDLLARAGFAFSPCNKRDLIVRYFLEHGEHDIARVNGALYDFDQELLGV
ncbi:MAG: macro domain-containing protein [Anaerolineaceae bacterium]|jgi:O-acetyl-ADP-ribose deacetylase (regulator of RNase III)|nr:macro domain-containing protein [Anaerolineaceae bacterium]MDD4043210.1 macro domain-containing protein [Anaerolineaceae bacterium]MDD4577546.1 macro domain-containing protein [Anaerolineaceae bacterium]